MTRRPQGPLVALFGTGLALLVAACPTPPPGTLQEARTVPAPAADAAAPAAPPFRLVEATGQEPAPARPRVAEAKPLDAAQTELLLARLPALPAEEPQEEGPKLRPGSLPPPRTGKTVKGVFPPPEQRERPAVPQAKGPLTVERFSPEGEVALAPRLSITFSQPMIAVTTQDAAAAVVPVKLTPEPQGKWRWVGTKTLIFEPEPRFPMATEYVAEVAAGTKSLSGAALAEGKRWSFATPPPSVLQAVPHREPQPLSPVLALRFDQAVDPAAVLQVTELQAAGRKWPLRLATKEEVAADPAARALLDGSEPGRTVALRVAEPLAPGTDAKLVVGPGTPSAEGPRRSEQPFQLGFSTFAPLAITEHVCGWENECRPGMPLQVRFNNPLDEVAFDPALVKVEPELLGFKVAVQHQQLAVTGETRGRTRYTVTIGAGLRDRFGQTLGKPASLTFDVGEAQPGLFAQGGPLVLLDPASQGRWPVHSVNQPELKVRLYAVQPPDFAAWLRYLQGGSRDKQRTPPGKLVKETTVRPEGEADQLVETGIDLGPALEDGLGQVIAVVSATRPQDKRRQPPVVQAWLQSTRLGLDAFVDGTRLVAWATSLRTGKPVPGARLTLEPWGLTATAGDDGLARFELPEKPAGSEKELGILVGRNGRDLAMLPEHPDWGGATSWRRDPPADALLFHAFDDRGLYRPGETAHVKGWVRRRSAGPTGELVPLGGAAKSLDWTLRDSRGNEVRKGNAQLDALGGFDVTLALPPELNLGAAVLELLAKGGSLSGQRHSVTLRIEEVRRPEFEVTASNASPGPFFAGSSAEVLVKAAYYAGGGLPDAEVRWSVTSTPAFFTPPNRGDFHFGPFVPWWEQHGHGGGRDGAAFTESRTGRTDGSGTHRLRIDLAREGPRRATSVEAEATVMDVNRQAWSARTQALVHPADVYVGLKSERAFVQRGEPLLVDTLVVDLDGRAVAGRAVTVRTARLEWTQKQGKWTEEEVDPKECALTSTKEPVRCERATSEGGTYRVRATVTDATGRRSESELNLWVAGGKLPQRRGLTQEQVTLIPDRKEYQPGETAQLLVQAPFFPAEGLLTVRRHGLVHTERFSMQAATKTLAVPIDELSLPLLEVQVDLVGAALREGKDGAPDERLPRRPAFAAGQLGLPVPPRSRTLGVVVKPAQEKLAPGESTELSIEVKDASGKPVAGADVAVVVVDEALLALTGYRIGDPVAAFYPPQPAGVRDHHLRAELLLAGLPPEEELHAQRVTVTRNKIMLGAPGAGMPPPSPEAMAAKGGADDGAAPAPIRARAVFDALALFAPKLPTDSTGKTKVTVKLPDSLTRYRITAVAISGEKLAGLGEGSLTARLPLMARPSAPRFLNFGDRFDLPVVVQNQTDGPLTVDVAARGQNVAVAGTGLRVEVPANDRVEVRFPVATARAGKATLQVAAAAGKLADAATTELPVWTPATTEAFATYGELDTGAAVERVELPPDAEPSFGELEVTSSSTALQALTDAVLYLVSYPYECAEQLASRVLAVAALKDVLSAFEAEGLPPPGELQAAVQRDLTRLAELQAPSGGFGFWSGRDETWPWVSIHVAHALSRAEAKGFAVPKEMRQRALRYLRDVEQQTGAGYGPAERRVILAYALFVRRRLGDADPERARQLVRETGADHLPLEAAGFLLQALTGEQGAEAELTGLRRAIANRATEEAGTAHFVTSYGDRSHLLLHSERRADGILLEALIADQPKSTLIPKLVRGLLGHRTRGRWANTQENAFVLLALDRYFAVFEQATPAFVSRVWLGNAYAGEHRFQGRTTERFEVQIPMATLSRGGAAQELTVAKEGAGRLYYRLGLRYAPRSLSLSPSDHGFTVERRYEAIDDPADVRREADGWHLKAGARVRVKLTMVAPGRRTHVALTDALPAGLEPVNPELATSGRAPPEADAQRSWWGPWYQHQNLRDERAEAFTTLLPEGVHSYGYVARATTPGRYVVPPAKAEEMYQPETFGRGGTDRVIVE